MFSFSPKFALRMRRRTAALAAAVAVAGLAPLATQITAPAQAADAAAPAGYWLVASDGGIFNYGGARFFGSTGAIRLNQPITGMAATPSGNGYWLVATDGGIFSFGDASFFGSTGAIHLNKPITGMAATPSGNGYWLVASDGGIFAFGDARFFGSTGAIHLNKPITGMASTPSGNGYWLVASDGGIFAFGDARFFGSTGAITLNKPITGMATTPSGNGYWLTASDGGVFAFGDARFFGAAPDRAAKGPRTVVAMVPSPSGAGYWQASSTGELLAFGDAADLGGPSALSKPIVGMTAVRAGSQPGNGGPGTTPTTVNTTPTTTPVPITGTPQRFSSTANVSWGTLPDTVRSWTNSKGNVVFPYAELVTAIAEAGNRLFVAGSFSNLADPNGTASASPLPFLAELDATTGAPVTGSPFNAPANHPDGIVNALAVSADGHRLYVGGEFKNIGGRKMRRLAALNMDTGQVDSSFQPPTPNAYVNTLFLSGTRLYIGGVFTSFSGTSAATRPGVAALDAATGVLDDTFNPPQNYGGVFTGHGGSPQEDQPGAAPNYGSVRSIVTTADGKTVMVAGDFLHFGTTKAADPGHKHAGLIALDTTGALTPWQPLSSRPTFGLTVWPGDGKTIFAATGGAGGSIEAYLPGFANTPPGSPLWAGHVDGDALSVASTVDRVYLVGHYDHEVPNANDPCFTPSPQPPPNGPLGISCPNGTPHRHLAAFEARTGHVDPTFTAQADTPEGPDVAIIGAHQMYVGGNFTQVSDTPGANYVSQLGLAIYRAIG